MLLTIISCNTRIHNMYCIVRILQLLYGVFSPAVPTPDLPPYAMYEDDVWVDEAKAVFAKHKKERSKELEDLLTEMFCLRTDVYSLLLTFVKRAGKTRQPPKSLPRIALATFRKWLTEREKRESKFGDSK